MFLILAVLLIALILGGLGFAIHILWWLALIVLVLWLLGFLFPRRLGGGLTRTLVSLVAALSQQWSPLAAEPIGRVTEPPDAQASGGSVTRSTSMVMSSRISPSQNSSARRRIPAAISAAGRPASIGQLVGR